jgi:hypothetical protein
MATVRELLREIEELKQREHVWLGVREYLEAFTPEGDTASEAVIDGVGIPQDVVIDVLADVDSECLGPIQARIREIEASKVSDGKASKAKQAKPKPKPRRKAAKKG